MMMMMTIMMTMRCVITIMIMIVIVVMIVIMTRISIIMHSLHVPLSGATITDIRVDHRDNWPVAAEDIACDLQPVDQSKKKHA